MTTKSTNLTYWICTILFAALMIFSAVGGIKPSQQAIQLMHDFLGYPVYFIQFLSVAKLIGSMVILIPNLDRIKEWAYAGLFFDLAGAIYSGIASSGKFDPMMLTMAIWILPGTLSYYFWHRRMSGRQLAMNGR
ncbi:DoxX family protein [Segetibacter koreensis]|uniref:DoxX family protein n=1 Tax=Segetibacter koreensis TaxID=398037 RepID=UPI000365E4A4|nr:DoxX family protein [Segetibacter koreensis]